MTPEWRRLAVRAYLRRLSLDDRPILLGPWRSEVGFEALYWLPFLTWCAKRVPLFWQRAVVVTRGGANALYPPQQEAGGDLKAPMLAESVDLYALRSVTEVRRENLYDWTRTKLQKQTRCTAWDRLVLRDAAIRALGKGASYHVLHPSWMYWALEPFWNEDRGLKSLLSMTDYTPLQKPPMPPDVPLPDRYVAMKFYGRATFPYPHPETHTFVSQIAGIIAAQTPIVLLDSGHPGDEHRDIPLSGPNIHRIPYVSPESNLALQAAVLGKATAFVGTYGGVAQLALRMGVPSVSVWTQFGGTAHAHLSLSQFLSQRTKVPFLTGSIADAQLWKQCVVAPMVAQAA